MATHTDARVVTQYLGFRIAGEVYGVELLRVREIIPCGALTRLPNVPACLRGVVSRRGRVLRVVGLAVRFGLAELEVTRRSCVVVFDVGAGEGAGAITSLGVLVDAVTQVLELADEDVEPPPAFGTQASAEFVRGMAELEGKFALLLDVDRALDLRGLVSPDAALALAGSAAAAPVPDGGE